MQRRTSKGGEMIINNCSRGLRKRKRINYSHSCNANDEKREPSRQQEIESINHYVSGVKR